jgi:hypothetical protein
MLIQAPRTNATHLAVDEPRVKVGRHSTLKNSRLNSSRCMSGIRHTAEDLRLTPRPGGRRGLERGFQSRPFSRPAAISRNFKSRAGNDRQRAPTPFE